MGCGDVEVTAAVAAGDVDVVSAGTIGTSVVVPAGTALNLTDATRQGAIDSAVDGETLMVAANSVPDLPSSVAG